MIRAGLDRLATSRLLLAGVTAALAFALALASNRIWRTDLSVPLAYSNDAMQYLMYSKAIHDHGWFLENGLLGAPFGLFMYDWSEGGWPSMIGVLLLDRLTGDWLLAHNLFYLIGYALAALTALWGLRRLHVAVAPALALSVLYAVLPYHLDRQTNHYVLSLYYGLPPVLSYAVTTAAGREPIPLRDLGRKRWLRRALPPVGAAVLAGLMSAYYVAFAGILLLAGGFFGWLRNGRPRVLLSAVLLALVIGVAMLAQYSPSLAYRLANGTNHDVGQRYHGETELYPLKLADLLLPVPGHPVGVLEHLRERYSNFPSRGQQGVALGMIGATGLLLSMGGFVVASAGRRNGRWLWRRLQPTGWLALVGLGVGMLGGGATIIGFIVGPYLRAWDRIAIAIAFLALAGVGVAATWLGRRFRPSRRGPMLVAVAGLLLIVGTVDQAATGVWVRPYAAIGEQWRDEASFVDEVEQALPAGAMVYQLPFIPFPENSRGQISVNVLLRPYLHSSQLRWSAGYMKGRDPGWQVIQSRASVPQLLGLLRALGFAGLVVQRDGYPATIDHPLTADAIVSQLSAELGPPTLATGDGRLVFWPLTAGEVDPAQVAGARDPIWMHWTSGFDVMYLLADHITHKARAHAHVELRNPRSEQRQVLITFALRPEPEAPEREVHVSWPDGATDSVTLAAESVVVERRLVLPPGKSRLELRVPGAPPRGFATTMVDLAVVDVALAELLPQPGP